VWNTSLKDRIDDENYMEILKELAENWQGQRIDGNIVIQILYRMVKNGQIK
jgi:hypothetical protein